MLVDDQEDVILAGTEERNAELLSKQRECSPIIRVTLLECREKLTLLNGRTFHFQWSFHSSSFGLFLQENDSE